MCIGSVAFLADVWDEDGARAGELGDGRVVPLGFLPDAQAGDAVLLHLGIPVEVLDVTATDQEGAER